MIGKQTRVVCTRDGDVLRAKILGEVDHHGAKDLREEIDDAILTERPKKVVLDLSAVADPSRRVARIIELAGLSRIIPIETTQSGGKEHA